MRPGCGPWLRLPTVAERLDQGGEGRRRLPSTRIVEIIAGEGDAPGFENPDEASCCDMLARLVFIDIGQTQAVQGRLQNERGVVEHIGAGHPHLERPSVFLEIPGIEAAGLR
ncbi:hypothetical protein D3C80_1577760 [compost metagenome]